MTSLPLVQHPIREAEPKDGIRILCYRLSRYLLSGPPGAVPRFEPSAEMCQQERNTHRNLYIYADPTVHELIGTE